MREHWLYWPCVLLFAVLACLMKADARSQQASVHCLLLDSNTMLIRFRLIKYDDPVISVKASDDNWNDINSCSIQGLGTQSNPFRADVEVRLSNNVPHNRCGMDVVTSGQIYTLRYRTMEVTELDSGTDKMYSMSCNSNNALSSWVAIGVDAVRRSGSGTTLTPPTEALRMEIVQNGLSINSVYVNEKAKLRIVFTPTTNPTFQEYLNAWGVYPFDCVVASSSELEDSSAIIGSDSCVVNGAARAPDAPFRRTSAASSSTFITESGELVVVKYMGRERVYYACKVDLCYVTNQAECIQRCSSRKRREAFMDMMTGRERRETSRDANNNIYVYSSVQVLTRATDGSGTGTGTTGQLDSGQLAGIIAGSLAAVIAACLLATLCCCLMFGAGAGKRGKKDRRREEESSTESYYHEYPQYPPYAYQKY